MRIYSVIIEDNRDGFCEVVAEFNSYQDAVVYVEDKVLKYLDTGFSVFIEHSLEEEYEYHSDYRANRCGWYDDDDPIDDYYGEVEEQNYWHYVFSTPESMVDTYFPKWYPSSALVDTKNLWYLGILRTLGGNHALHQTRRS